MAEPLSLGHLGRVLLRYWVLLVVLTVLGGLAAYGAALLVTPVYTATATQLVKGLPGKDVTSANYQAAQYARDRAKSYPAFIYSNAVLEGVRSDLKNAQTLADLRIDLTATNPTDTPLLRVSATGSTPTEAALKANSAAKHLALFITQIETVAGKSPISVETPVEAALPVDTTSPKKLLWAALGALLGFALGVVIALLRAYRRSSGPKRAIAGDRTFGWDLDDGEALALAPSSPPRVGASTDDAQGAGLDGSGAEDDHGVDRSGGDTSKRTGPADPQ